MTVHWHVSLPPKTLSGGCSRAPVLCWLGWKEPGTVWTSTCTTTNSQRLPTMRVSALRLALDRDIGDHFQFEVIKIVPLQEEAKGSRVHVQARLGPKAYAGFHIDVVVGTAMSGQPDVVPPLTPVQIDGLVRPPYRAFPLADHVADKFCAIITGHSRAGVVNSSSRIKDLVDIALIA